MPCGDLLLARSIDGELSPFFVIGTIWVGLLGAILGSFVNVVALRLPAGVSCVTPRSRCPRCQHPIAWYDNVPLLSFALLRGRCRHCRGAISWQYPLVEAIATAIALGLWFARGPSAALLVDAAVCLLLLTLALIDARTFLLPEPLTVPLIAVALAGRALVPWLDLDATGDEIWRALIDGAAGAALGFLAFGLVRWLGTRMARRSGRIGPDEEAMGVGDLVLIAGIGAHVGLLGSIGVIFLGSSQGALIGGLLLLWRGRGESSAANETAGDDDDWRPPPRAIPYGPFLALAAVEWVFAGLWLEQQFFALFARFVDVGG
ncbi:MAG: prepilin peptidase [Deltaproteobacteria bacterium]|nr:prepilin peptidase [Deltaproteobacteria bacterium]